MTAYIKLLNMNYWIIMIFTAIIFSEGCISAPKSPGMGAQEEDEVGLKISKLIFCMEVRGDRDYDLNLNASYAPNSTIWIYFEVTNFTVIEHKPNCKFEVWVKQKRLTVHDPYGELIIDEVNIPNTEYHNDSLSTPPSYLWFQNNFDALGLEVGKYTVKVTVEDMLTSEKVSRTAHFYILEETIN
jgi:hypothetical protein